MTLFLIFLFLLLSALFSGSEIAYVSANKLKIELKKKRSAGRGSILTRFYDKPASFLGTMLVGNNIALVVFTILMEQALEPYLLSVSSQDFLLFLLNTIIITLVVLVFGEFLPKTIFRLYADDVLYFLAYPLRVFQWLLSAPAWIMTRLSNILLKRFLNVPVEHTEQVFTRIDLEDFVNATSTIEGQEEEIDRTLFGKALNLKDVRVREAMVPRPEIENVDVAASIEELEQKIRETKLSRIIVTDGDIDNVLGYVHHQSLLHNPKTLKSIVMEIPFVTEVMGVTDLMNNFIKSRLYIACVVDEFGGVSGIITLEDILEELFGEIEDEHDQEGFYEEQISDQEFLLSGRLEINYLNEKYKELSLPEGDYHTLSGYLVMTTETIPEQGTEVILEDYRFIFELVSDTKIETVRVIKLEELPEE